MSNPADYLSDEDCDRMDRALDSVAAAAADEMLIGQNWGEAQFAEYKAIRWNAIRRAWSSRPESARALDAKLLEAEHPEDLIDVVMVRRDDLKASGSDEPSDRQSPTGGAA